MANQYRLGNQHNEESSPYRNAVYLRLFGSNIRIINGGQTGARPTEPAARSDYQRSGVVAGNSSNVNFISSFNDGINTTTAGSRSPNQGSQVDGSSSRRRTLPPPFHLHQDNVNMSSLPQDTFWDKFLMNEDADVDAGPSSATTRSEINSPPHVRLFSEGRVNRIPSPTIAPVWPSSSVPPRQPITTSDALASYNYRLNPPLSPPGSGFTFAAQTNHYIQTGSGSPRSENVASHGGIHHNFISTSHELRPERNRLRVENFSVLDYWATQNRLRHSQEHIDRMINTDDWFDEVMKKGLEESEIFECIQKETYQPNTEETSTMNQTCTICQEDYIDGERIGRTDCNHIYHLDCICQWLEVKNVCPICKAMALRIYEENE